MKICFVAEYYEPHVGGVEIVFKNLAERLAKLGHKSTVVTTSQPRAEAHEIANGVEIFRVAVPRFRDRYWFAFFALPRVFMAARNCDVIHATTYSAAFPAFLASRLLRKPCVITVHEIFGRMWGELNASKLSAALYRILERLIVALPFDKYVCVSEYTKKQLSQFVAEDKIAVIYNGVEEIFNPAASGAEVRKRLGFGDSFVYLAYGRPGISKGCEHLIEAVPEISRAIPNSRLLLILAREPEEQYRRILERVDALGIRDRIILLDSVPRTELPEYIAAADCVVVPSLSEGFGFAAAEACAVGKPVVATNAGALPEVIFGKHVLVEPGSSSEIARGAVDTYANKYTIGEVKKFQWEHAVNEYLKIYEKLTHRTFQEP